MSPPCVRCSICRSPLCRSSSASSSGWPARSAANRCQPRDTALDSPFTRRVRLIVLHGIGEPLQTWRHEDRDLPSDFHRLFGDESAALPPLRAVVVSGDADNTGGHSIAHLRELQLR